MDIEDIHPLREMTKFDDIWFRLKCCRKYKCCKPKPDFKYGLRKTLLAEMDLHVPESEKAIQENPFIILGYGVNAYFEIIQAFCYMMGFVTLFYIPVFSVYSSNPISALSTDPKSFINVWSLGNYGASRVMCKNMKIGNGGPGHREMTF